MDLEIALSVLGLLGIGGIIGSYFQHVFNQRHETELKIQEINEQRYRSTLVWMRCLLSPKSIAHFQFENPVQMNQILSSFKNESDVKSYARSKIIEYYYNGVLYAPDKVVLKIKSFIQKPSEIAYTEVAIAMREDLWKHGKTSVSAKDLMLED